MLGRLLVGAAVAVCLSKAALAQDAGSCLIQKIEGRVTVSAGGSGRQIAAVGLSVAGDATVRTRADARVTLLCPDDLVVVVGPGTEIAVARLAPGERQPVALRLVRGIAGFLFEGDGDGVQVNTPSAVAAVRSTQWAMRVEDGATAVFARDGTVFVRGDAASVRLASGDGVDVSAGGDVGSVVRWGQARIDLFAQFLGPNW